MNTTLNTKNVNGFVFNLLGELIEHPSNPSLELLQSTLQMLYEEKEYISASRIQHLININYVFNQA